jgi:hypothetical protein
MDPSVCAHRCIRTFKLVRWRGELLARWADRHNGKLKIWWYRRLVVKAFEYGSHISISELARRTFARHGGEVGR